MAGARPGSTPTMLRSPCWGPVAGKGSKAPLIPAPGAEPRVSRRVTARSRSCGEPAGRCPTATWARTRDIARLPSKRFAEVDRSSSPQPAAVSSARARSAAPNSPRWLGGLLALALDPRLRGDRRHCRLVMATGTIPDHIRLRDALLGGLRLDLGPGELGLGQV